MQALLYYFILMNVVDSQLIISHATHIFHISVISQITLTNHHPTLSCL